MSLSSMYISLIPISSPFLFHPVPSLKPYSTAEPLGTHCRLPPSLRNTTLRGFSSCRSSNEPIVRIRHPLGGALPETAVVELWDETHTHSKIYISGHEARSS